MDSHQVAVGEDRAIHRLFLLMPLLPMLLSFLLAGCVATMPEDDESLAGNVILWHSWDDEDALVLEQILDQVTEINPDIGVLSVFVPADELLERYIGATSQGVGPDLLLGSSEWVRELVETETVRSAQALEVDRLDYYENALSAVQYDYKIYGFPLSLYPVALYYNTTLTQSPPSTLEELLEQASAGNSVALVPRFKLAHWGIQSFGHGLYDSEGRFTLDGSGFTEWLEWLNEVQHEPGVILNTDDEAMEEMFVTEGVVYYVGGPDELGSFQERMAVDHVNVVPLPSGPEGPSGPLLPLEAVMLSTSSSETQSKIALAVAHYLTNPQQSTTLMRDLGRVPANRNVRVDPRVYPVVSGFWNQSRTAVTLPNELDRDAFYMAGDRAYANALAGVLTPAESVCLFGQEVIAIQNYTPEQVDMPAGCEEE